MANSVSRSHVDNPGHFIHLEKEGLDINSRLQTLLNQHLYGVRVENAIQAASRRPVAKQAAQLLSQGWTMAGIKQVLTLSLPENKEPYRKFRLVHLYANFHTFAAKYNVAKH